MTPLQRYHRATALVKALEGAEEMAREIVDSMPQGHVLVPKAEGLRWSIARLDAEEVQRECLKMLEGKA